MATSVADFGVRQLFCCRWFFQQLILAVDYLHAKGVASRDIKAENLLLDNSPRPLLKICDFGFSTNKVREAASKVGTVPYMAPEVILASENSSYDAKVGHDLGLTRCIVVTDCYAVYVKSLFALRLYFS